MPIDEKLITNEILNNTLRKEIYPQIKVVSSPRMGKVRTVYDIGNEQLIMISSDDLSTHDVVHQRQVYGKGDNLDAISSYYFDMTKDVVPNHLIETLAPNVWLVQKAQPILVEMVFRNFLTGSGWKDYVKHNGPERGSEFCGEFLRSGYSKNQKLDEIIFTPTGKGQIKDFLSVPEFNDMVKEAKTPQEESRILNTDDPKITVPMIKRNYQAFGLRRPEDIRTVMEIGFRLYQKISADLASKGELLADTKWEFGYLPNGTIILMDECVTPDSSRFWKKSEYRFKSEKNEFNIVQGDKQPFRDYVESLGLDKEDRKEELAKHWMADQVLREGVIRYCNMRETITGTKSLITATPRKELVLEALASAGYLR
jgi:phosphoribosylaminoimidazole-succinocarboxamide synthase